MKIQEKKISAYTPGLVVTRHTTIKKTRRLPLQGEVIVEKGQDVKPHTIVAHTQRPGHLRTINLIKGLSIDGDAGKYLLKKIGDSVEAGEVIARCKSLFGLFTNEVTSPFSGTIELYSKETGNLMIRLEPTPIELTAYISGQVKSILPNEGAEIETQGTFIQGIFGVGGERHGNVLVIASSPKEVIDANQIPDDAKGKILVGGALFSKDALKKAEELNVKALITGSITGEELANHVGYEIGVVTTGQEKVNTAIVVTEGFGNLPMAKKTFKLLESLNGTEASVCGATQIRAGVIRPEIIVPTSTTESHNEELTNTSRGQLDIGSKIRLLRDPYFGLLASVYELPDEPTKIESGATIRVLKASLPNGEIVTVPRANVELVEDYSDTPDLTLALKRYLISENKN